MPKSTFGVPTHNGRRRGGTVTVIEQQVRRDSIRTAKITFYVMLAITGLITAVIASYYLPPIAAFLLGLVAGTLIAGVISAIVLAWPVLRAIWWWIPEITFALIICVGWVQLSASLGPILTAVLVAVFLAVFGFIPQLRNRVVALAWCQISRHRLRVCFNEFIIANRSGSLPFILWAKPMPVGERIWIWLRPGLSLPQLTTHIDKIAVACWAREVTVEIAGDSNSAFVRLDIKRRDALTGLITSPLIDMVDPATPASVNDPGTPTTALDLADIPAENLPAPESGGKRTKKTDRETVPATPNPKVNGTAPATANPADADWI